jgi:hypothetical protein
MMTYGGVEVPVHVFSISALGEGEWSALCSGSFTPEEKAPAAKNRTPIPRKVQVVARRYNDWDIPDLNNTILSEIKIFNTTGTVDTCKM